jgi:ABC-type transport system involved in multi-copper enzyme maturation permease subunit
MILAIVGKELRETWAYATLAVVLFLGRLNNYLGGCNSLLSKFFGWIPGFSVCKSSPPFPFLTAGPGGYYEDSFGLMAIALAVVLGLRQSAWEPSRGTLHFLLQQPLSRRAIFLTKIATGIALVMLSTLVPILVYAGWAATPGTHASPFEWSMTWPTFRIWLVLPLVYLAAFATGIRPAAWYGTRLMPLVAVAIPAVFTDRLLSIPPLGVPLLILIAAGFTFAILSEAETRDF